MKYYFSLFAIIVIVLSSCSENSTEPANTIQKSKEMPNFIFPLSVGNSWDYTEYKTNLKASEGKYYYDTLRYTLSIASKEGQAYNMISSHYTFDNSLAPYMFYHRKGASQQIYKDNDSMLVPYQRIYPCDTTYNSVNNKWLPAGKRLNQKYGDITYDEVYIWSHIYNNEIRSEYHFVKGIGLVYWAEYDMKLGYFNIIGKLGNYSIK